MYILSSVHITPELSVPELNGQLKVILLKTGSVILLRHFCPGERMRARYPTLLTGEYHAEEHEFRHTDYSGEGDRTRDSARAYVQGLFGSWGWLSSTLNMIQILYSFQDL